VLLKTALDTATENQDQDPAGYEKARIAYYTLLNGQGWLNTEKQRIATQDVQPVLNNYNTQYNALKGEKQSQSVFTNLSNALTAQEGADTADNAFLKKQLASERDRVDVMNRMNDLANGTPENPQSGSYIPLFIDIVIGILLIGVLFLGFTKINSIKNMFGLSTSVTSITT
jgi:glutamine synthetase adenylyltransferase